jgi:hypothetical protein
MGRRKLKKELLKVIIGGFSVKNIIKFKRADFHAACKTASGICDKKTMNKDVKMKKKNSTTFSCISFCKLRIPSNAHISTPFFQKTVFFSKICFGKPPSKFLEVCLNSEYMWYWSPVYNFNCERALKKLLSAGVAVTSTSPNSGTLQDLQM